MELIGSSSNAHQHSSEGSHETSKDKLTEKEVFIYHAEIAWYQRRREWVGNQSKKLQRPPKDSIMSLIANYGDILLSEEPFQQPIPLAVMIDTKASTLVIQTLYLRIEIDRNH